MQTAMFTKIKKLRGAIFCLLLVLAFAGTPSFAQTENAASQDRLGNWMKYYYLEKDQKTIHDNLALLEQTKLLDKNRQALMPFSAFMAVLFTCPPAQIEDELRGIDFTGQQKSSVELGLWLSGNAGEIKKLFNDTPAYAALPTVSLLNFPIENAGDLDVMWGAFFASGDTRYVERIIGVLDEQKSISGNAVMDKAIRGAALWSLSSNMDQHELVRRTIVADDNSATGTIKAGLDQIMAAKKAQARPFPASNGDFSAMLLLVPDNQMAEFSKPSNQGVAIKEIKTIRRGEVLWVKMVFAGMELSPALDADVTYDLTIYAPNGKIYDNNQAKGLVALKRKVPMRFSIFDNDAAAKLSFDPQDPAGQYKFVVRLTDNIGKRSIDLERQIELVP